MSDYNFRRRDILKKTTVASAFPMATGMASAQQSELDTDLEITEISRTSPDVIKEDIRAISRHDEAEVLASRIEDETGFEMNDEFAVGIDLETDDEELNARNPRIMHLPVLPPGVGDISTVEAAEGAVSSQPEFSIDNGSVLLALTVQEKGERTPAALMGITREKSEKSKKKTGSVKKASGSGAVENDAGQVDTKSFVVKDGSAKRRQERTGRPLRSDWKTTVERKSAGVTAADSQFTCWGCATVVGVACAGAATLSMSSCASAAVASGAFSPLAGGAVSAFCLYIVSNAGTLSCAAGTAAICSSVTDDCDFLE